MTQKYICNKSHECKKTEGCSHATPHSGNGAGCEKPIGGTMSMCHTGQLISICVPVIDGKYTERYTKGHTCSCGHQHWVNVEKEHMVENNDNCKH